MLKQKIRKVVSFALATTMSIAMAVTGGGNDIRGVHAASNDLSSQVNFSTILGRGVDYGIIAENFQQRSHMQTTYAVGSFSCACDGVPSEANLNPVGSTAHFLIGDVVPAGQEQYSRTTKGPVYAFIGGDGTNNLVVEASENVYAQEEGKDSNFKSQNFANTDKIVDNNTTQHVKDLCDSVFGVSNQLSVKATSDDAIDYRDYFTTTGGGKDGDKACLDLTSGDFANKVVYIDVDDDLLAHMNVADNFNIIKDSSTVIVFNIGPDVSTNSTVRSDNDYAIKGRHGLKEEEFVTLSTYSVSVDNGNSWIRTTSSTGQDGKEDETAKANYEETRKLDMEVNQKIIWNITTNHEVALDASAGLFIVPNAFVDVIGSSTGWVVAKDIANTTGEWHYTYCGNVFENKNAIGKLTVKKTVTGNVPAGYTSTYKFTVKTNDDPALYVQDENGTLGLAEHVFDVTAGDEVGTLIEKIDVTKNYIVEEVAPENLGDSLTCDTTYDDNTVDYTDKKEATVVINNDFKRITGSLTVSKVEDGDVNGSGKPSTYSFYIKSGDKYVDFSNHSNLVDEKPATPFSVSIASKTTVDGLVAGRAYTVEEAEVTGLNSGFSYKPSYVYDGNASNAAASITKDKQEATAEITNNFNQAKTVVTLSKKDINGTGELKGAELRITTDAAGQNVVNDAVTGEALKWISTDVAKKVSLVNGVYYMTETTAPEGYDVSETVAFEVENGFVTKVGNAGDVNGTTVTMFDAPTVYKTNVKISKQAVGGGAELVGAEFTLTGVDESGKSNIFKDENVAGTSASISKDGETITFVSGNAPTEIKNLLDGTYTLVEKAAPEGYEIASSIRFSIRNGEVVPESVKTEVQGATPAESGYVIAPEGTYTAATGSNPTVITMFDAVKVVKPTVEISKQDVYSNELPGATLTLTGKAGDNTVIFTEENISSDKIKNNGETIEFVSGEVPTTIKNLPDGKYTLHEEAAPSGYLVATNIEFEIKDGKVVPGTNVTAATEDKNAVITMVDDAEPVPEPDKTDVKISKQAVGGGDELEGATFTLTGKTLDADGNTTSENVTFTTDNTEGTDAKVSDDSKTITFVSGKAPTEIKNLPDGTYTLVEKAAPEGYEIASSIIFTIKNGAVVADSVKTEVQGATPAETGYGTAPEGTYTAVTDSSSAVITMFDAVKPAKTTVDISKQDVYDKELPGATLTLTGKAGDNTVIFTEENISSDKIKNNGETIEFVSGDAPTTIKNLPDGKYTLHEEAAPSGYLVATNIEFEIKDGKVVPGTNVTAATEDKNAVITMVDDAEPVPEPDKTDVKISKQAVGGGAELEGATFTLTGKTLDADGNTTSENVTFTTDNTEGTNAKVSDDSKTITFESGKAPTEIKNLPDGTYTLVEKAAPEGYEIASSIIFTIKNGAVVADSVKTEVQGATPAETGYGTAPEGTYTAATDSSSAVITMFDAVKPAKTTVDISKQDVHSEELPGATLTLKGEANGRSIIFTEANISSDKITDLGETIEFVSGDAPTTIKDLPDGKYTLHEEAAPKGYLVSTDIEFEIKNGVVTGTNVTAAIADKNVTITMVDDAEPTPEPAKTTVEISKQDVDSKELPGATLTLTGKTTDGDVVFTDANIASDKIKDNGKTIEFVSGDAPTTIKDLPDGKYTLHEEAAPKGYVVATNIEFEIKDGKVIPGTNVTAATEDKNAVITMVDDAEPVPEPDKTDVKISKQAVGGGAELEGATFTLTGKTLDADGNTTSENITFTTDNTEGTNAKVSDDSKTITFVSGKAPTEIKNLPDGTYTLVEKAAPEGYEIASSIIFTIKNGSVVADSVKTEVQGATPAETGYGTAPEGTYTAATDSSSAVITMFDAVKPAKTTVDISKQDVDGAELEGAELTLKGEANGRSIIFTEANISSDKITDLGETIKFVSGKTPTTIKDLPDGKYTLHEEAAPKGYVVATNIEFEIKDGVVTGTNVTAATADKNVTITMVDGAEPVTEEPTTEEPTTEEPTSETPTTEEPTTEGPTEAPTEEPTTSEPIIQVSKTDVKLSKQAVGGGAELEGATLTLTGKTLDAAGNTTSEDVTFTTDNTEGTDAKVSDDSKTITFESGKEATEIKSLPDGTYTLTETAAPEGYEIASSIIFTIKDGKVVADSVKTEVKDASGNTSTGDAPDGTFTEATEKSSSVITMFDAVKIVKEEPTTEEPTTEAPKTEEPTTEAPKTEEPTTEAPKTEEPTTEAPKAEEPTTEAPKTEEPTTEAPKTEEPTTEAPKAQTSKADVKISKQAVGGGAELEGATLTLTGKDFESKAITFTDANVAGTTAKVSDDNKTITFVSGKEATEIKSLPDGTYTLTETAAPEGYEIASSITFTIKGGKVVADSVKTEVVDASGKTSTGDAPEGTFTAATEKSSSVITMFDAAKASKAESKAEEPTTEAPKGTSSKTDVKDDSKDKDVKTTNTTTTKTGVKEEKTTEAAKDQKTGTALQQPTEQTTETATEQPTETTTQQPTETTTQQPSGTPSTDDKQPTTEVKQPTTTTNPSPNAPSTPQKDTTTVSTGDSMNVVPIIVVMILALAGIIFLIIRKRKMRYEY